LQRRRGVVLAFVGDGGSSEGDFFESCNLAAVMAAPVVFVVQNNGWAISTPVRMQTRADSIAARAAGFGMAGALVDGNDLFEVHGAVGEAVARARNGEGPTLVECRTYRLGAHNTNDDPSRYRGHDDDDPWLRRDPVSAVEAVLRDRGLWGDQRETDHQAALEARLEQALAHALAQPEPALDQVFNHVYADPPLRLQRQRRQFEEQGAG
jgi:pyruvate dehydrogenase E1 component alpha subunit